MRGTLRSEIIEVESENDDSVNQEEVDQKFEELLSKEEEEASYREWIKSHGILALSDVAVGAANLGILVERLQMCISHLQKLSLYEAELYEPVGQEGIAILQYPDEEIKRIFEG